MDIKGFGVSAHRSAVNFIILKVIACYLLVAALVLVLTMVSSSQLFKSQQQAGLDGLLSYVERVISIDALSSVERSELITQYLSDKQVWFSKVMLQSADGEVVFQWSGSDSLSEADLGQTEEFGFDSSSELLLVAANPSSTTSALLSQFDIVLMAMMVQLILLVALLWVIVRRGLHKGIYRFVKELSLIDLKKPAPIQQDASLSQFSEYQQIISSINRVILSLLRSREALADANEDLERRIASRTAALADKNEALIKLNQQLSTIANTDSLTQVYNRTRFDQLFAEHVALSKRRKTPLSILLIDLDDFKKVNDQFGHQVGDQVLKHAAQCITKVVGEDGLVARWGGEEFAALLPYYDIELAESKAEQIRGKLARARFENFGVKITTSIGVAELCSDESSSDLLKRADDALYDAKGSGRNRVIIAYLSLAHQQLELETLADGEFIEVFDAEPEPSSSESVASGKLPS